MAAVWPAGPEPMTGGELFNTRSAGHLPRRGYPLTILLCIVLLMDCSSLDGLFLKLVAARAATQREGAPDLMVRLANVENSLAAFMSQESARIRDEPEDADLGERAKGR